MFAPVAQNRPEIDPFSLQVAAPSARRSRISCFPSLRTSVSPCRGAHPSPSVGSRGCTWRPHFFSPRRVASSLKSMQIFHEALFAARASANHREKKHPSGQPLFPPPSSRRALFSFCRRCPTWRYVKRIYNWRYDGRALESNTSILIPATYAAHPSHPAYAPLSLSGQPLECQSAPWPIGFYRVDIEFIPHSREIWWEICGQG